MAIKQNILSPYQCKSHTFLKSIKHFQVFVSFSACFGDFPFLFSSAWCIIIFFIVWYSQDFEETLKLVQEYKFPSLFINQFFPRPGTPAAKLQRIPPPEVRQR